MKKVAVVLSGCGHKDGSEITESVSTLIALSETGAEFECFAPDIEKPISSYLGSTAKSESRNILAEAARIARGNIRDIKDLHEKDFDAIVFPGGSGAAKNLSNWNEKGAEAKVLPEVERVLKEFHKSAKPIGAICVAPTLVAKVLGKTGVNLTIGDDKETAQEIEKTGAHHVTCPVTDYISDRDHKVLTTPAYMYHAKPHEVFTGIRKMIRELVEMA